MANLQRITTSTDDVRVIEEYDLSTGAVSRRRVYIDGVEIPKADWSHPDDVAIRVSTGTAFDQFQVLGDGRILRGGGYTAPVESPTLVTGLDYTASSNSTSALQDILDAASARAVLNDNGLRTIETVQLLPGQIKLAGLVMPAQVRLVGNSTKVIAASSGSVITSSADWWEISRLAFVGGGSSAGADGIAVTSGAFKGLIKRCTFDGFAGRAMLLGAGTLSCAITECFAQGCLADRAALVAKTGVVELAGADHHLYGNNEFTASCTSLTSVNAYACAVAVTAGGTNFLNNVLAETSDIGFYIAGVGNQLVGCRSDLNRSHGFEIPSGNGQVVGCYAYSNGQETTNTYDGFRVDGANYIFDGCVAATVQGNAHKYGFNDTQNSASNKNHFNACRSYSHGTAAFAPPTANPGLVGPFMAAGNATLASGTKAVADTLITATSKIRLTNMGVSGTAGVLSVALNAGVGFTINSTSGSDASSIYYEVVRY